MNKDEVKLEMAKIIAHAYCFLDNPDYDYLMHCIYDNQYRVIMKMPTNYLIIACIEHFEFKCIENSNKLLKLLKEVIQDSFEIPSGIELTYTDEDWNTLHIVENTYEYNKSKFVLKGNINTYLGDYFEI